MMSLGNQHPLLLLLLFTVAMAISAAASDRSFPTEKDALLTLKRLFNPSDDLLTTWNSSSSPCLTHVTASSWQGVSCNSHGSVSHLVLESLSLSAHLSSLLLPISALPQLRLLSLKNNLLSGHLPDLTPLSSSLRLLFLSNNSLSGPLPTSLSSLSSLHRLDLSHNNLTGPLPTPSLNNLSHLLTLRLDHNRLSGPLSSFRPAPSLQDLDLSSNLLSGPIPSALSSFPLSSFSGNPFLCGTPLPLPCRTAAATPTIVASDPTRPGGDPSPSSSSTPPAVVTSSPGSKPEGAPTADLSPRGGGTMSRAAVVAIVVGDFAILLLVCGLLFLCFWRKYSREGMRRRSRLQEGEKIVYSSSPYTTHGGGGVGAPTPGMGGFDRGKMVFLEAGTTRRFELEDLLRASAEMLGKGGYGTAYKAVLDDGSVVAVKRLRELSAAAVGVGVGKREFEQQMEMLGNMRHPNLVGLKAYYFARDEKLLVYDFMAGGSLFSLLHANRGPGRTPLDWATRVRIATGAARGLAFIHHGNRGYSKLAHGNIKSNNILLNKSGVAHIADFGLALLGPATVPPRSNGYRAPECAYETTRSKPTQKADVYSFGVLLLELLTGKYPSQVTEGTGAATVDLPRWVQSVVREEWTAEVFDLELMRYKDIEEEMVAMLQIAMACTAAVAEQRPSMAHVLKMIEEIAGVEASPSHESFDSISDSPSVSDAGV